MAKAHSLISENAARLRTLHEEVTNALSEEGKGIRWSRALAAFRESYDRLAFPGGLERGLAALKAGDTDAVEHAVRFLESNPYFFRSGYIKEEIIRRLKHVSLSSDQRTRMGAVILDSLSGYNKMPRKIAQLAPIADSPEFRRKLEEVLDLTDEESSHRARQVLHVLHSAGL